MTMAPTVGTMALLCAIAILEGCSKSAPPAKADPAAKDVGRTTAMAASLCDRHILSIEDLSGILNAAITGSRPVPGDAQSCEFVTAAFPAIIVSVRPGIGRTTVDAWVTGKMPLQSAPLREVGDGAVWLETLHEVIGQKNAVLCDIQVRGGNSDLVLNPQGLPGALGALCNKIFTAY
jgi:hypothetical protein